MKTKMQMGFQITIFAADILKGTFTFSKAGGGFLPLQRLDRAHTAFLVIVNLVDLVRSLKQQK